MWLRTEREFNDIFLNLPTCNHWNWDPKKVIYFFTYVSDSEDLFSMLPIIPSSLPINLRIDIWFYDKNHALILIYFKMPSWIAYIKALRSIYSRKHKIKLWCFSVYLKYFYPFLRQKLSNKFRFFFLSSCIVKSYWLDFPKYPFKSFHLHCHRRCSHSFLCRIFR